MTKRKEIAMPGQHKEPTITFRPSVWEKAIIDQRITLSGMRKKDFIVRSCIYSNIVVVGKRENIQRIVDALQEMQMVMKEIAGQIQSGIEKRLFGTYGYSCGYSKRSSLFI